MTAPYSLAPMEGVTTFPTRLFYALTAPPARMTTPFLRATETFPHKAFPETFAPEHRPELAGTLPYALDLQIMAADEGAFERASDLAPKSAMSLELNCGCPSPTCTGKGAGSSLLKEPAVFFVFVERLVRHLGPGRLAVKMRTGYAAHAEFPTLLAAVAALPLARLTVHGRTRPQGYTGKARWDLIGHAVKTALAPVHASGDVVDAASALALADAAPGLAGTLVGRGALRHPWIFAELGRNEPVRLPAAVIPLALRAFGLLHDMAVTDFETLVRWAAEGAFAEPLGADPDKWSRFLERFSSPELQRATLGRTKMLWNYWRSGLPASYFAPETLRAKSLAELCERVATLGSGEVALAHQPDCDWVYAGAKKTEGASCAPAT